MPENKVYIIGVAPEGADSLSPAARRLVTQAELVFGGERLLKMLPSLGGEKVTVRNNLAEVARLVQTNLGHKRMVVLASGDPGFFGIGRYMTEKLGKEAVDIIPNVSAMQVAFARIRESWDDAALVSLHARPIEELIAVLCSNDKVGVFTDNEHTPAVIAGALLELGFDGYKAYVCQDLGTANEKVVETDLRGLSQTECSALNVLILQRDPPKKPLSYSSPGIPDDEFYQRRPKEGLITKLEVRAVSLAKMCLDESSTMWDIGAGSGAVSIEASFLARKGHIYAIERNPEDAAIIRKNIKKFHRYNIKVVEAFAPDKLDEMPDPEAVFIGGSGGRMEQILDAVSQRLKSGGRIVVNVATLENLHHAAGGLTARGFSVEVALVNIARSRELSDLTRLEALNPVFIITGRRKKGMRNAE